MCALHSNLKNDQLNPIARWKKQDLVQIYILITQTNHVKTESFDLASQQNEIVQVFSGYGVSPEIEIQGNKKKTENSEFEKFDLNWVLHDFRTSSIENA